MFPLATVVHSLLANKTGVPQVRSRAPSFFNFHYASEPSHLCIQYYLHQCADDTQVYTSINVSSDDDINKLSNCANAVTRWHLENNVLQNPSKTEALVTGTKQQVKKLDSAPSECWEIRFAETTVLRSKYSQCHHRSAPDVWQWHHEHCAVM